MAPYDADRKALRSTATTSSCLRGTRLSRLGWRSPCRRRSRGR